MNQLTPSKPDKHSKLKMALIPLLALLLLYVMFRPKETSTAVPHVAASSKPNRPVKKPNSPEKKAHSQSRHQYVLPQLSIVEITQHDPFRLLPLLIKEEKTELINPGMIASEEQEQKDAALMRREAEAEKMADMKEALEAQVISGILYSTTNKAAIINSKVYHEGDFLNKDVQVIKINPDGVIVQIVSAGQLILK